MAWCSPTSPRPKKNRLQKSKVKTPLKAFFDNKGIIHKEFVPAGQTIYAAFYQEVLNRLLRILRVRPELYRTGKWIMLHDNVPTLTRRVHGDRVTDFFNLCEIKVALCTKKMTKAYEPLFRNTGENRDNVREKIFEIYDA